MIFSPRECVCLNIGSSGLVDENIIEPDEPLPPFHLALVQILQLYKVFQVGMIIPDLRLVMRFLQIVPPIYFQSADDAQHFLISNFGVVTFLQHHGVAGKGNWVSLVFLKDT